MRATLNRLAGRVLPNRVRVKLVIGYQNVANLCKYGDWWFPHTISMEISKFCNRTCPYCPNVTNKTPTEFMEDDLLELALQRMKAIRWTGPVDYNFYNEPTLDPRLLDIVAETKRIVPKALPRVVTNGDFLTVDYVQRAIEAGVVYFGVTRHPPFKPAWDSNLAMLKNRFPDHIILGQIWDPANPRNANGLSNRAGAVNIPGHKPLTKCDEPSQGLIILIDGSVVLCCADYHRATAGKWGNIKTHGLLDIWANEEFRRIRKEVRNGTPKLEICNQCFGVSQ